MNRSIPARTAIAFTALALLASPLALAMQSHSRSLDDVLRQSPAAVVAVATSMLPAEDTATTKSLSFRAGVVRTVFGDAVAMTELRCRYEEGRPHLRDGVAVSPLVSGSGSEFGLQPGNRVVLLLEHAPVGGDDCTVLRIEPAASAARIARMKRGAAGSP